MAHLQNPVIVGVSFIPDKAICFDRPLEAACACKWQHSLTCDCSLRSGERPLRARHWVQLGDKKNGRHIDLYPSNIHGWFYSFGSWHVGVVCFSNKPQQIQNCLGDVLQMSSSCRRWHLYSMECFLGPGEERLSCSENKHKPSWHMVNNPQTQWLINHITWWKWDDEQI